MKQLFRTLLLALRNELHTISHTPATALIVVGGVVIYGLIYNLVYEPNVVRKAPIVVVDESHSWLSERFISLVGASPSVEIATTWPTLHEAQDMIRKGEFLEYDAHAKNYYGTPRGQMEEKLVSRLLRAQIQCTEEIKMVL